ncbi:uncharacterized protein [Leptinotarsa decemlineata]|uniref:uncharacterized protein n=1 Tax=Leptinotarsa decemlineata TaxID=7539 RepID=UPI003D305E25
MKILIAFSAILGITCASSGFLDGAFGEATKEVVEGAVNVAKGATHFGVGGSGVGVATKGAALIFGKASDAISGLHKNGKNEYFSIFQYYNNLGIQFFPNTGCCTCPIPGVVKPGLQNYSPNSPFFINGVHPIHNTQFCTCPPELVASAVQASHHNPGFLGNIAEYVEVIPHFVDEAVKTVAIL